MNIFSPADKALARAMQDFGTSLVDKSVARAIEEFGATFRSAQQIVSALVPNVETLPFVGRRILDALALSAGADAQAFVSARREHTRLVDLYRRRGWIGLGPYTFARDTRTLLKLHADRGGAAFDAFLCARFRARDCELLEKIVQAWMDVPYLKRREQTIRQAANAHRHEWYALTSPALFPLVDGLAAVLAPMLIASGLAPSPRQGSAIPPKLAERRKNRSDDLLYDQLTTRLIKERFYKDYRFGQERAPSVMNRHAVMHGQTHGHGTERHSLQAFLLLDAFATWYLLEQIGKRPNRRTTAARKHRK